MQLPKLQRGRALIITGPQACGKSRLAREIGRSLHTHEIDAANLDDAGGLGRVMALRATILIVNGLPRTATGLANVKHLITNATVKARAPYGGGSENRRTPLLIFTTNETARARELAADGRRIDLLDMATEPAHH